MKGPNGMNGFGVTRMILKKTKDVDNSSPHPGNNGTTAIILQK